MKGQNLAFESVAAFGLTIMAAIAIIQIFSGVEGQILSIAEENQAEVSINQLKTATLQASTLNPRDTAEFEVSLSEEVGGNEYEISVANQTVSVYNPRFSADNNLNSGSRLYNFTGTADGGNIGIFKTDRTIFINTR